MASPKNNLTQNKVFAYGRDDANGHHLACASAEAQKDDDFIKHIKRFDHLKVYKVEAGAKTSFVCCEGEEDLLSKRYQHSQAQCYLCKASDFINGPLHFTVTGGVFTYYCLSCVQSKPAEVPKVCFALKSQIANIQDKQWPDLSKIEIVASPKEYTCNFTKQRFSSEKSSAYLSQCKLTELATEEYCLCEDSFSQANSNDINPVIYMRIS